MFLQAAQDKGTRHGKVPKLRNTLIRARKSFEIQISKIQLSLFEDDETSGRISHLTWPTFTRTKDHVSHLQ